MISVVVVTYNSGKTLKETLDSIYEQTYSDIELIISDDGSKDDTLEISKTWMNAYAVRFLKVQILESENSGVALNCNRGIFAASGDYIQIIAGDDILLPEALEMKLNYAQKHNLKAVFCKTEPFGDNVEKVEKMRAFCERGYKIISLGYESQREAILVDNYIAGPSGGFYDAEFIKGIKGYDERYPMLEDYPFIYHFIYMGYEIRMIDTVLSKYRISDGSLCNGENTPMSASYTKFFFRERLCEMIKEKKFLLAIYQTLRFSHGLLKRKLKKLSLKH